MKQQINPLVGIAVVVVVMVLVGFFAWKVLNPGVPPVAGVSKEEAVKLRRAAIDREEGLSNR